MSKNKVDWERRQEIVGVAVHKQINMKMSVISVVSQTPCQLHPPSNSNKNIISIPKVSFFVVISVFNPSSKFIQPSLCHVSNLTDTKPLMDEEYKRKGQNSSFKWEGWQRHALVLGQILGELGWWGTTLLVHAATLADPKEPGQPRLPQLVQLQSQQFTVLRIVSDSQWPS